MKTEILKLNRKIDAHLTLIERYESNIEMLKGFREQYRALDMHYKEVNMTADIAEVQQKIERCYFKIEELSRKINNLVNNELIGITHQEKEL